MDITIFFLLIAALTAVGVVLLLRSRALRQESGLPSGQVVYSDTGAWQRCERPLFSQRYRLSGRPDYLVEAEGATIPVEVKSTRRPAVPYRSHVMQLAAYCLLIEETRGQAPPYGLLRYSDDTVRVDYAPQLRGELLVTLEDMRRAGVSGDASRSHDEPARCRRCGYRHACDQRLAA
ncbi:MAG: CRISPR-associated protein Cas4 [Chloroflexi bacterium]|nr:CRISPR-associated protein Cas4 [Chloroflexota bacterium]